MSKIAQREVGTKQLTTLIPASQTYNQWFIITDTFKLKWCLNAWELDVFGLLSVGDVSDSFDSCFFYNKPNASNSPVLCKTQKVTFRFEQMGFHILMKTHIQYESITIVALFLFVYTSTVPKSHAHV